MPLDAHHAAFVFDMFLQNTCTWSSDADGEGMLLIDVTLASRPLHGNMFHRLVYEIPTETKTRDGSLCFEVWIAFQNQRHMCWGFTVVELCFEFVAHEFSLLEERKPQFGGMTLVDHHHLGTEATARTPGWQWE